MLTLGHVLKGKRELLQDQQLAAAQKNEEHLNLIMNNQINLSDVVAKKTTVAKVSILNNGNKNIVATG